MDLLVVDDDAPVRMVISKQAARFGYEVSTAEDGLQARDILLENKSPRLVIMDWMMPNLSGIAVCKEIRAANLKYQPYIIVMTARSAPDDIAEALDAGADDFIAKPYSPVELRARLGVGRRYIEAARQIKLLRGLLPICSGCRKIRNDEGYWHQIEAYLEHHSEVELSHTLCPDCLRELHPGRAERILGKKPPVQPNQYPNISP